MGTLFSGAFCGKRGARQKSISARPAGGGYPATMGWAHERGFVSSDHRGARPGRINPSAARAQAGNAPKDPEQVAATLSWQSYSWPMQSVWLENAIRYRPARWLPESYANYVELLTAALDAAICEADAGRYLNSWNSWNFRPVEIQYP